MKPLLFFVLAITTWFGADAQTTSNNHSSLSGRVLDSSGKPLSAQITLFKMTSLDGFAEAEQQCDASSDAEGKFECNRLPAGKYLVRVSASAQKDENIEKRNSTRLKYEGLPFFYPATTDTEMPEVISLRDGEFGWAEVRTQKLHRFDISGTFPEHPQAVAFTLKFHAGTWLLDPGIPVHYDAITGQFKISQLRSGHYELTARWAKDGLQRESELAFTLDNSPLANLKIPDDQLVQISGHFVNNQAIDGISQIELQRLDGTHRDVKAQIKNDAFQFAPVPEGQYTVTLSSNRQAYVAAITSTGKTSTGPTLVASAAQNPVLIEVQLGQPATSLEGTVNEWSSNEDRAQVVMQSEDTGQIYATSTNEHREFSISGLNPGSYRLFAWPGISAVLFRNPQILKQYWNGASEVSVGGDGTISNTIELSTLPVH